MPDALPLLILALSLGLDSFRATLGLGALHPRPLEALRLAGSFGIIEAAAPLAGIVFGDALVQLGGWWTAWAGSAVLAAAGIYVLAGAARAESEFPRASFGVATSFVLPLSLSLDNLLAGGGLGLLGVPALPAVALIGMISGLLALGGFALGAAMSAKVPERSKVISGLLLLVAAGAAFFE